MDIVMPAGDGTHRIIEAEAIRALIGYIEDRDGLADISLQDCACGNRPPQPPRHG